MSLIKKFSKIMLLGRYLDLESAELTKYLVLLSSMSSYDTMSVLLCLIIYKYNALSYCG